MTMERRYSQHELEQAIGRTAPGSPPQPDFEMWRATHAEALRVLKRHPSKRADDGPHETWAIRFGRKIMKSRRSRFATAAALAAAVVLSVVVVDWLAPPAWAIGQTVKALKSVRSIVIRGVGYDDGTAVPFTFSIRRSRDGGEGLDIRVECEDQTTVVRGKKAWVYWPAKNVVNVYEDVTMSYGMMRDLQWWYDVAAFNPWITGNVLAAAQHVFEDWEEVYGRDEHTGRDCVFVTCAYGAQSRFWFVCDLETKLIVEAKYWNWSSPDPEGPPACHATSFAYNEDIDDAVFEFQMPEGVRIVDKEKVRKIEQEARVLSDRAERLLMDGQYAEAIEVYQQVYDRFPDLTAGVPASTALCMMGDAYRELGEPAKAVEILHRQLREYGHLEGREYPYFSLGRAYLDLGDKEKALKAFQDCLAIGAGRHDPHQYPLKHAREYIERIKTE